MTVVRTFFLIVMQSSVFQKMRRRWLSGLSASGVALFLMAGDGPAFPPAPFYTIYGDVRDENGALVPAGAILIFSYQSKEVARYPITATLGKDYNYEIRMRMDMNAGGTPAYNSIAVKSGTPYTLKVDVGGVTYVPIEFSAKQPVVGAAADRKRLDLTLGVDSDLDGLPDSWERSMLQRLGYPLTDLSRITPDGILEADGLTNLQKYISGTYSGDTSQSFYLKIKNVTETDVVVDFYTLTNKVYTIEKSSDLANWAPVEFGIGSAGEVALYTATASEVVTARIPWVSGEEKAFYRLRVR